MRITKAQAIVITVLNIIIAALLVFIFAFPKLRAGNADGSGNGGITPPTDDDPPSDNTDVPPAHEKLRDATNGATPEIARETRLMGNGDESVAEVFFRSGTTYIFGNATVAGLDFDSYGGFLCTVNAAGTILSFDYFEGNITAVCNTGAGFAVCAAEKLHFVDYDCTVTGETALDGAALDVFSVGNNKLAVVTQPTPTSLKFAEYVFGGGTADIVSAYSTRIDSGYTLKYFDCYDFGETFVIAARAYSLPRYDATVFFKFVPGGDAESHYYGSSGDTMRPYAVMPCSAGYFALAAKNGIATIVSVDYTFMNYHSYSLGFTFADARLLYSNGKYFACFDRTDGAVTYELESDLSRRKLSVLDGVFIDCAIKTDRVLITGALPELGATGEKTYSGAQITSPYSDYALSLDIKNAVFYGGFDNGGKLTIVLSATGGDALSKPTAGRDVYVVTIKN